MRSCETACRSCRRSLGKSKQVGLGRKMCVAVEATPQTGSCWGEIGCQGAPLWGRKLSHSLPTAPQPSAQAGIWTKTSGSRCKSQSQARQSRC